MLVYESMSGQSNISAAIIGAGFMGPTHIEALRRLGIPILGVADRSPEEAEKSAARLGLPKGYATVDDLLADPNVTSVHITTPNSLHYSQVCKAIEAGKHVLCEKPLAMTSTESADLVQRAAKSGLVCGVNYNIRFYPMAIEARQRVRSGELGRIFGVRGAYVQDWLLYDTDYNWRVLSAEGGTLRAVADIGTHWLDLVHSITGLEITEVCAELNIVHKNRRRPSGEVQTFTGKEQQIDESALQSIPIETEDQAAILFRFSNGAIGTLWVSQTTAGRKNTLQLEISAQEGAVSWDSEAHPNTLWIGSRKQPNMALAKDPSLLSDAARSFTGYPGGHQEGFPDTFKMCFKSFYDTIRGNQPLNPFASFEDGHRELLLCDAIMKSAQQGGWVKVGA